MDFIEKIVGMSPDGGSGTFELALVAIAIAGIAILLSRRDGRRSNAECKP